MVKFSPPMWIPIPVEGNIQAKAIFTTRHGGISSPPYNSLNLSFQRTDSQENVRKNFELLSKRTGIPIESMVLTKQVHGSEITVVNKRHRGMGIVKERTFGDSDGLITADKNVAIVTFHADCIPVYLYDSTKKVIGLVHSGWRSTLQKISAKAVRIMKDQLNCRSEDIGAVIGPCIRKCCFEVGVDVYEKFYRVFSNCDSSFIKDGNKRIIDLVGIVIDTLTNEGLGYANIHDVNRCTVCENELFFSHRGGQGISGTGAALFVMNE